MAKVTLDFTLQPNNRYECEYVSDGGYNTVEVNRTLQEGQDGSFCVFAKLDGMNYKSIANFSPFTEGDLLFALDMQEGVTVKFQSMIPVSSAAILED